MSVRLTPAEEEYLQSEVETGRYPSVSDALSAAVDLLRRRDSLKSLIEERYREIERGEYTDYDETELKAFFDELKHGNLDAI